MKTGIRSIAVIFMACLLCPSAISLSQSASALYEQGLLKENAEGDLMGAIAIFNRVVEDRAADASIRAKAQLRIGMCFEKLGNVEAVKAYEAVLSRFAEQAEVVAQARVRLNALRSTAETSRGPSAHRILTTEDIGVKDLILMKPSPDGGRMIYLDTGDGAIIMRDVSSGKKETLAEGLPAAFNGFPLWSPDGKKVAYLNVVGMSKGDIKILDLSTREKAAISGTEFTFKIGLSLAIIPVDWSRDGRFLLLGPATLGGDTRGPLGIISAAGGTVTILADSAAGSASFSPDSRFVTFASGDKGKEQIFVRPVGEGNAVRITGDEGGNTSPFWSPDGQAIVYQCSEGIRIVQIADGKASGDSKLVYSTAATLYLNAWTEAGGLFFTLYNDAKIPFRMPVDPAKGVPMGPIEEISHYPTTPEEFNWMNSRFAWSPDMNRIAFAGWSRHIAVYTADGSSVTTHLVFKPNEHVMSLWWSNDGKEIFWLSFVSKGQLAANAVDPSNGKIREVIPPSMSPVMISESRDGHRQLFYYRVSDDGPMRGFVVKEAGQTAGKLIVPHTDSNGIPLSGHAMISPQGDHVLFGRQIRKPEYAGSLWIISTDGTGLRKLGSVDFLLSALWDPNGRFVAYSGEMGKNPDVFRIVDVSNGKEYEVPLLADIRNVTVTDWSRDGKFIGIVAKRSRLEYWALRGLQ